MRALIVTSRPRAVEAGMNRATCHHKSTPEIQFWWPALGTDCLRGTRFDMIVWEGPPPIWAMENIMAWCTYPDGHTLQVVALDTQSQRDARQLLRA